MAVIKRFVWLLLLLPLSAWATPTIDHWKLKNGVRVYFVEAHELPIVQVALVLDAGSARDPKDRAGLAGFVAGMLEQGAGERSATQLAEALESLGVEYGASTDQDMTSHSLRSLAGESYLEPAVDILRSMIMQPRFDEKTLERERQRALVGFQKLKESPGDLAERAFFKSVYGDHPYAHPVEGNEDSIRAVSRGDLLAFHKENYVGRKAVLVLMGDLKKARAKKLAKRLAGSLPKGHKATPLRAVSMPDKAVRKHVQHKSTQTHIHVGQPGMRRGDPDYFPLYVGNYILGGSGLVARLSERIREKEGMAYSVYSYFWPMRMEGPFMMGMQTKAENRDRALELLRDELEKFVKDGPTEDELRKAKQHLTGGFPLRIDSNKKITQYLAVIGFYNLPLDYLDRFNDRIEAVTREQIRDAFRRRIQPNKLVTVTAGPGASPGK